MKYGYSALNGVVNTPDEVLDKVLAAYFHSDTATHGIDVLTNSLRSDVSDGGDISGNIDKSLRYILSSYYTTFTLEVEDNGIEEYIQMIGLSISVIDNGTTITFDKVLNITDGELKEIVEVGYL